MNRNKQLPVLTAPEDELAGVLRDMLRVRDWDFDCWEAGSFYDRVTSSHGRLADHIAEAGSVLSDEGAVVVRFSESTLGSAEAASAVSTYAACLGRPLKVFSAQSHWRRLGVDLTRAPERSGGSGESPLHMDFVNAEQPPDLVLLLCLRPDPMGGGYSVVSDIRGIEAQLRGDLIETLSERQFQDGRVVNLGGIGEDINPFAVLDRTGYFRYRYTGALVHSSLLHPADEAVFAVDQWLRSCAVRVRLQRGDLLVLNQHAVVHGRGALGPRQADLSEDQRRHLRHSFVRAPRFSRPAAP